MSYRDDSAPDITLTHSGGSMSFYLYEDPQAPNVRQWMPSFLPENVSELQQGPQTYDDRPKAVSQPVAFQDFTGGCGIAEADPFTTKPSMYSYSQGVDASWQGNLCLSPQAQTVPSSLGIIGFYFSPTYGMFGWSNTTIYHLQSNDFVATAYAPPSPPSAMIEYGNATATYLFLAMGDAQNAVYSTDSFATATAIATSGNLTSFWAVRGNTSTLPVLFSCTVGGLVKSSTNPLDSANWSNVDYIGSAGQHVNSTVVANDLIWYLKREGVYTFDGTNVAALANTDLLNRISNGKSTLVWVSGMIYTAFGNRVLQINPYTFETSKVWAPTNPELNGTISAITADLRYLYVFMKNAAGNTYVIKIDLIAAAAGQIIAHTIAYLAATTVLSAVIAPAGTLHASNDTLIYGTTPATKYYILPRDGYRPWEDSNCRFEPTGGTLFTQWVDCGAMAYQKWVNGLRIVTIGTTGAQSVIGAYALDGDDSTFATVATASQPGVAVTRVTSEITFSRVKLSFNLLTGDNAHTPRMIAALLDVTPNPPRHRMWTLNLDVGDMQRPRSGGDRRPDAYKRMVTHLFGGVGKRCTYIDYFGASYVAKLVNVTAQGIKRNPVGDGRAHATSVVQVVIVEIDENGTIDDPFIWGDASGNGGTPWDAGYQWNEA